MNASRYQVLVEASWSRPLTPEEQAELNAWLADHPELEPSWEAEAGLNRLLDQLTQAPLSSNFTAQVLQELDRGAESRRRAASPSMAAWWREIFSRPGPRVAWAVLLTAAIWFGYDQHRDHVREQVAQGLTVMANVTSLSDPGILQDFEAIHRLSQSAPGDDEELFAVLTQ